MIGVSELTAECDLCGARRIFARDPGVIEPDVPGFHRFYHKHTKAERGVVRTVCNECNDRIGVVVTACARRE